MMTTPRRDFLQWLGASGAMAAIGGPSAMPHPRALAVPPVDTKWDMSWCDRITGTARAVFDSPQMSEGAAVFRAVLWQKQQAEVYGTKPAGLGTVVVLRHEAIPLVMNDEYWDRFSIGKESKLRTAAGKKWAVKNPVGSATPAGPGGSTDYNLPALIANGGIVLACNLAFSDPVSRFKNADKLSAEEARARAIAHLIPGVILQPSGGFAALRAQQAGCAYLFAS